ncbi:MAG: DUF1688 family protein [Gordonia sp. (in: high G+C Gram-positive bacteria)]
MTSGATAANTTESSVAALRTTDEIRRRAGYLTERARSGHSRWFRIDDAALADTADIVAHTTATRYPSLQVPFHSRWRHFEAGGIDRVGALGDVNTSPAAQIAMRIDLAVVSVLLDAGAGPDWHYTESATGQRLSRSEGLAVASLHAFADGLFSATQADPYRVDADGLRALTLQRLATAFQVGADNPIVGLNGRLTLLHRLADALDAAPDVFGADARPGGLAAPLVSPAAETAPTGQTTVRAHDILTLLLDHLGSIWPSPNTIDGVALGDCWRHTDVDGPAPTAGWMPFHKLSQWLTYSLLEPFADNGVSVCGLDALTALPEYRNGGLLLDTGVLVPQPIGWADTAWRVDDEFIVEWRALTVSLLDELAPAVCRRLGLDPATTPLACILEGGTWAAGRELAAARRHGLPPLHIISDGTVF